MFHFVLNEHTSSLLLIRKKLSAVGKTVNLRWDFCLYFNIYYKDEGAVEPRGPLIREEGTGMKKKVGEINVSALHPVSVAVEG